MPFAFLGDYADVVLSQAKLVATTLAVLYVSSHASLRRPPSAAPAKKKSANQPNGGKFQYESEEEEPPRMEGLQTSDAILFPVLAAIVLVGLYYLLQYLQDPEIVSKILQWYISITSIASLVILYSHGLQLGISFMFPRYWRAGGEVYRVCQKTRRQLIWKKGQDPKDQKAASTPLGPLSFASTGVRPPAWAEKFLWNCRELLTEKWNLELKIHGIADEKTSARFHQGVAILLSIATVLSYHLWRSYFISNLIGLAFCYTSGQYLSPNSFITGFSVLGGLFVYDIVMVFFTPFMVTVATKIEAPMKLTIETGAKVNILGLGDIAVPCLLIALALRFDLWMCYQRLVKHVRDVPGFKSDSETESEPGKEVAAASNSRYIAVRAPYVDVSSRWADWLHTLSFPPWKSSGALPIEITAASFSKPYFYAAMGGYSIGMILAMVMSLIFKHGQPALLYLVPAVVGSLLLTAVLRGELREMMLYNEDGRLDNECSIVELDERGKLIKFVIDEKKDKEGEMEKKDDGSEKRSGESDGGDKGKEKEKSPDVFLLRISAPVLEVNGEEAAAKPHEE